MNYSTVRVGTVGLVLLICALEFELTVATRPHPTHTAQTQIESDEQLMTSWTSFKLQYNKSYVNDQEDFLRSQIFEANLLKIHTHNSRKPTPTYLMAMNEFGDLTSQEFHRYMQGDPVRRAKILKDELVDFKNTRMFDPATITNIAPAIDWRTKNAVTPIKNQLSCGCDYAFAAVGAIEGAVALKTNKLISLSEQQIVDCSQSTGNQGCHGGGVDNSFNYVIQNQGITSEVLYPYNSEQDSCQTALSIVATISYLTDVQPNESALLAALNIGPVAVYIDSSSEAFQFYSIGILDDPTCGTAVDHAVLVVGYGSDPTTNAPYYIIKNSWGPVWGLSGYALLARNVNQCGIATRISYPVV